MLKPELNTESSGKGGKDCDVNSAQDSGFLSGQQENYSKDLSEKASFDVSTQQKRQNIAELDTNFDSGVIDSQEITENSSESMIDVGVENLPKTFNNLKLEPSIKDQEYHELLKSSQINPNLAYFEQDEDGDT